MQEPLLSATLPNQPATMPNPVTSRAGILYPRWPLMGAVFLNLLCAVGSLFWRFVPCPTGILSFLCGVDSLPGVAQFFVAWFLFLVFWLLSFIFGYGVIEGGRNRPVRSFLRIATNFEPIRWLLAMYGVLAGLAILAMIFLNQVQPLAFSLASIVLFVVIWVFVRRARMLRRQTTAQEQHEQSLAGVSRPLYVFRSLPLIRGIWRPSPPHMNRP